MWKKDQEKIKELVQKIGAIDWEINFNTPIYNLITYTMFLFELLGISFFIILICGLVAVYIKMPLFYLLTLLSFGFGLVDTLLILLSILILFVVSIFIYWKKC